MFQVIARTNELLENSNEQRRKQEKILEEKQEQINKMEANMKSVTADVIKVQLLGHGWSWFSIQINTLLSKCYDYYYESSALMGYKAMICRYRGCFKNNIM